jgi:hypothetical protein
MGEVDGTGVLRGAQDDRENIQKQGQKQRQRQKQIPFGDDNQKETRATVSKRDKGEDNG